MSIVVKNGNVRYNPIIEKDGLFFYLDPKNPNSRDVTETRYRNLISIFNDFTSISAGLIISKDKTLVQRESNYYINIDKGNKSLYGNIGPANALSALENFTIQLWIRNNSQSINIKNIFSNTDISVPLLSAITNTVYVSTNYPFSNTFNSQGNILGKLNLSSNINGRVSYRREDRSSPPAFNKIFWNGNEWVFCDSNNSLNSEPYFLSKDNVDSPIDASNWVLATTTFKFDIGDIPQHFFSRLIGVENTFPTNTLYNGLCSGNVKIYSFYRYFLNSTVIPVTNEGINQPFIYRPTAEYPDVFTSATIKPYPWQSPVFSTTLKAISCSSNIFADKAPLSGFSFIFQDNPTFNGRDFYAANFSKNTANDFQTGIAYFVNGDLDLYGIFNIPDGWYVIAGENNFTSLEIILSSNSTAQEPWEVPEWKPTRDRSYTSVNTYLSVVKYIVPSITAVPTFPESYSNIVFNLTDGVEINSRGIFLSGVNNSINFSYENNQRLNTNNNLFKTDIGVWQMVTIAQSGNNVTIYKNLESQTITGSNTRFFNLSNLFLSQDVTLGQILLYNKCLNKQQVTNNYYNFLSRYTMLSSTVLSATSI